MSDNDRAPEKWELAGLLSDGHWKKEDFRQRMTRQQWRTILLNELDTIMVRGHLRQLRAKSLGVGVVEVFKKPPAREGNEGDE